MTKTFLMLALISPLLASALGQSQQAPISDEQRRFLEVRRRQIELRAARTALKRTQQLFEQGLVAETQLDQPAPVIEPGCEILSVESLPAW